MPPFSLKAILFKRLSPTHPWYSIDRMLWNLPVMAIMLFNINTYTWYVHGTHRANTAQHSSGRPSTLQKYPAGLSSPCKMWQSSTTPYWTTATKVVGWRPKFIEKSSDWGVDCDWERQSVYTTSVSIVYIFKFGVSNHLLHAERRCWLHDPSTSRAPRGTYNYTRYPIYDARTSISTLCLVELPSDKCIVYIYNHTLDNSYYKKIVYCGYSWFGVLSINWNCGYNWYRVLSIQF